MSSVIIIANNSYYKLPWDEVNPDYTGISEPLLSQLKTAFSKGVYAPFGNRRLDELQFASGAVNSRVLGNTIISASNLGDVFFVRGSCRWASTGALVKASGVVTGISKTGAGAYRITTTTIPLDAIVVCTAANGIGGLTDNYCSATINSSTSITVCTTQASLATGGTRTDTTGSLIIIY